MNSFLNSPFLSFLSSGYFYTLIIQAVVINRIMAVAVPIIPAPLSFRSTALLRVPLLIALTIIMVGLTKSNDWVNALFYLFTTSHAVDKLILCLETGVTTIMSNDHSPNLVEWGLSVCFF
jgi:hypothetical protein